jgi:hypothetical protein
MQLVAYGAQDQYLVGNPQVTFFRTLYGKHTNYSPVPQVYQPLSLKEYCLKQLSQKHITELFVLKEQYPEFFERFDADRKRKFSTTLAHIRYGKTYSQLGYEHSAWSALLLRSRRAVAVTAYAYIKRSTIDANNRVRRMKSYLRRVQQQGQRDRVRLTRRAQAEEPEDSLDMDDLF